MSRNRFVVLVGVLAMSGLLAASVGVTAAAGPDAAASAGKAKKCKKLKGKAKKKCLKRLKQQQQAATTPALTATTLKIECTVGCAPYQAFPISAFNNTSVTMRATLASDSGGTPVVITYRGGAATPTFSETLTTGAGGVVTKTHDLNNDFGYDNVFTAAFAGDATRSASSASFTYRVSD